MNLPTIFFTNIEDCLLKDVLNDLKILSGVNIFHENYHSAATFIKNNYKNIFEWWNRDDIQEAELIL